MEACVSVRPVPEEHVQPDGRRHRGRELGDGERGHELHEQQHGVAERAGVGGEQLALGSKKEIRFKGRIRCGKMFVSLL